MIAQRVSMHHDMDMVGNKQRFQQVKGKTQGEASIRISFDTAVLQLR